MSRANLRYLAATLVIGLNYCESSDAKPRTKPLKKEAVIAFNEEEMSSIQRTDTI